MSEIKTAKETVKNSEYDTNPPIILNKQQWQCIYNWMQEYANQQNQELQMQVEVLKISNKNHSVILDKKQTELLKLKEVADEMANLLQSSKISLIIHLHSGVLSDRILIDSANKSLETYKHLTNKT